MHILLIDTSGPVGVVVLAQDGKLIAERRSEAERDHAGKVNLLIQEVLESGGISPQELDAVAVCNGPGSYTGLRIGLATAKGFCYALDKPLILHNRLSLLVREVVVSYPHAKNFLAILPARKGEYYTVAEGEHIQQAPAHILIEEVQKIIQNTSDLVIIGDVGEIELPYSSTLLVIQTLPDINTWLEAATNAYRNGAFADIAYAVPDYLKAAYTTLPKRAGIL